MCGRFTLKKPNRLRVNGVSDELHALAPRYNIAPSQEILVVRECESQREATFVQWGLIPSWSQDGKGIINARVETLEEKRSFSESFSRRRCLILADGFYEWERMGKISQPYYFEMKDSAPFAFAGVWDQWRRGDRSITSCAIITTTANELLAKIHRRMPVILSAESYDLWLSEDSRVPDLKEMLIPFPAEEMMSHAVGYEVNNANVDHEGLLQVVEPNIGVTYSLF